MTEKQQAVNFPRLAFLGAGSMGSAILDGVLASELNPEKLYATTRTAESLQRLPKSSELVGFNLAENPAANEDVAALADVLVLGVKPGQIIELLSQLAPKLKPNALIISLAAGVTIAACEAVLNPGAKVFRVMPNTPAKIAQGMTGISAGSSVQDTELELVVKLFSTVGEVLVIPEEQQNQLAAVSGSGPAYVFYLIEEFTKAAQKLAFSPEQAALLAQKTFLGAVNLLAASNQDPVGLRKAVTSPKGTTEQAIAKLQAAELEATFETALQAAVRRAEELAAENR